MSRRNLALGAYGRPRQPKLRADTSDVAMSPTQRALISKGLWSRIARLGLTDIQAAEKIGVSVQSLYRLRDGTSGQSHQFMQKIAAFMRDTKAA